MKKRKTKKSIQQIENEKPIEQINKEIAEQFEDFRKMEESGSIYNYELKEDYIIEMDVETRKRNINVLLFDELKQYNGDKTLYLGCNNGSSTTILSKHCKNLVGVDINEAALEVARENAKKYKTDNVKYVKQNIVNMIGFDKNEFDCVYAFHVLEHIYPDDLDKTLNEIKRILKPNGIFIIELPHPTCDYEDKTHVSHFESEEFIKNTIGKHFEILEIIHETRNNPAMPGKHNDWRIICKKNE